jgi:hypothetical protein
LGLLDNALFGSPKPSGEAGAEVIKAREFDITQYGKKMAVLIGVLAPAIVGGLKVIWGDQVTPAMVIAALGVTAIAIFSASLVMAVDMIARALVTREAKPAAAPAASNGGSGEKKSNSPDPLEPGEKRVEKTVETSLSRG